MNNQVCFSDLRHQESDDVAHATTQKKLQAHSHQGRDHYNHFNIENPDENVMMKDDEKLNEELHQRRVSPQNDHVAKAISLDHVRQIVAHDTTDNSKPSSIVSQGSMGDGNQNKLAQKLYQTPQLDKRYEAKFSTFENSELFSGARENQYTSNYSTNEKKVKPNHSEPNSQKSNDPCNNQGLHLDQQCQDNLDLSAQSYNAIGDSHENSSIQKTGSFSLIKERERRSCRDKTSKYSLTHKGVYSSNIQGQDDQALNQNAHLSRRSGGQQTVQDQSTYHQQLGHETSFTQGQSKEGRVDNKPLKKIAPRTSEQCLNIIKSMFAFDWSLKDIGNLRHSPQQELTSAIYWFYVNTQYFPFKALELSQQPLEDLIAPILQNLKPNNNYKNKIQEELKQQNQQQYENNQQQLNSYSNNQDQNQNDKNELNTHELQGNSSLTKTLKDQNMIDEHNQEQNHLHQQQQQFYEEMNGGIPDFIITLFRDKRFRKFKKQYQELQERLELEIKQQQQQQRQVQEVIEEHKIQVNDDLQLKQDDQKIEAQGNSQQVNEKNYENDIVEQQQVLDEEEIDDLMMECQETIQHPKELKQKLQMQIMDDSIINEEIKNVQQQIEEEVQLEQTSQQLQEQLRIQEEEAKQQELQLQQQIQNNTNRDYDIMIDILEREIQNIEGSNREQLQVQARRLQEAYQLAINTDISTTQKDMFVYRQEDMLNYDLFFLAQIDPLFINDFLVNSEWYKENFNEILLNVGHPSKLEKDFLKHIEYIQQKKSDLKYKRILKQIEQGKRGDQISLAELEQFQTLNSYNRNQVGQEDAQCAICNNGDYEEEDMIVFCGNCNVPVHQSCYGIEQLPEGDWICYNCEIFGMKRGLMVSCLLCPKKGGTMKPTNIFSSFENYRKFNQGNSSHAKKTTKKHHHFNQSVSEKINLVDNLTPDKRINIGENEDKNLSLTVILNREFNFQSDLRQKSEKQSIPLETLDLIFDANEKITETPEDYSVFLHKNESRLEIHSPTECLYQWVHLSCASWIPGPLVTPKTPVRLNKFDEKRFQLQCIICLKKDGACMQCQAPRCSIAFHVECARRNNYCMEIERKDRDKTYRMFCEKHRPLKIVKEMEERDKQTIEEIQKFCKIVDKCMDIDYRHQLKPPSKHHDREKELMRQQQRYEREQQQHNQHHNSSTHGVRDHSKSQKPPKPEKVKKEKIVKEKKVKEVIKKWREKDKKMLFERVKEKYLMFRKMRINIIRIDPMRKLRKTQKSQPSRKRSKKRTTKKQSNQQHTGGSRPGLRSTLSGGTQGTGGSLLEEEEKQQDILQLQNDIIMMNSQEEIKMDDKQQNDDMVEGYTQAMGGQDQTNDNLQDQTANLEEDQDIYYKLSIPTYPTEIDWTITLSRNDFPWPEIKFNNFSAKDCYDKYISIVKDAHGFLKKVLGLKEKYKKMMQNQLVLAQQMQHNQHHQPGLAAIPQGVVLTNAQEAALYCKCKGQVISDLYVKCDGDDECVNGGWVHPQCTEELKHKTKEELDAIEEWYCEECQARIKKEDEEIDEEEQKDEEEDEEEEDADDNQNDEDGEDNGNGEQQEYDEVDKNNNNNNNQQQRSNNDYSKGHSEQSYSRNDQQQHIEIDHDDNNNNGIDLEDDDDHMLEPDEQELQEAYLRENNYNLTNLRITNQQSSFSQQQHSQQQQQQYSQRSIIRKQSGNNNNNSNSQQQQQQEQSPVNSQSSHQSSSSSSSSDGGCF